MQSNGDPQTTHRRVLRLRRRRGGYVLVLLAMMLFGLFAMAGLVIDLGFARMTQRNLQSAADSAAIEGLRSGRQQASDRASLSFDDDFDSAGNSGTLGAGPLVNFGPSAGNPDLAASQLITLPETPFYRPSGAFALQLNPGNDIAGDMLEGEYAFEPAAGSPPETRKSFHKETPAYSRADFPNPDPGGTLGLTTHPAFLVRLRRTDEDPTDGILSSGPPLPYLFGRGSTFNREALGNGIQVRGTSVAVLQPVVCVGEADSDQSIEGSLNLAVPIDEWIDGSVTTYREYSDAAIGGEAGATSGPPANQSGYLAIFDPTIGNRVIGFQTVAFDGDGNLLPQDGFSINNASPVFSLPFVSTGTDDADVFRQREVHRAHLFRLPISGGD